MGSGRKALVAGSDSELVSRQDVVRLVDPAGIGGDVGWPISLSHVPIVPDRWTSIRIELEAAAFRRLVKHLRERPMYRTST